MTPRPFKQAGSVTCHSSPKRLAETLEKPGSLNPDQCHVSLVRDTLQFEVARMDKTNALYHRVSHRDQSHASQLPDLERWAEAHDGPIEWFKDTFTGRHDGSPRHGSAPGGTESRSPLPHRGLAAGPPGQNHTRALPTVRGTPGEEGRSRLAEGRVLACHHQQGGFTPGSWHPSPSMKPRSGLSVFTPVSKLPGERENHGAARRRAGGGG